MIQLRSKIFQGCFSLTFYAQKLRVNEAYSRLCHNFRNVWATALIKSFDLPNKLGQCLYSVVAKTHQNSQKGICILNRMETKRERTSKVNPVKNMAFCVCCPENDKLFQEQPFTSVYSRNKRAFLRMCKKENEFFPIYYI